MSRLIYLSLFFALVAGVYRLWLQPILIGLGQGRVIEPFRGSGCTTVPGLTACEKTVLHAPTGVLYLACSSPASRAHWVPTVGQLNISGPDADYIATYNPVTGAVARLQPSFPGLSVHGMDVVPSSENPSELFIYAINHRKRVDAEKHGADSVVEIFKTTVGSTELTHMRTVADEVILTPNDLVGSPDGKSFFFTNDHPAKTGLMRSTPVALVGYKFGSIGYCDVDSSCKHAVQKLSGSNGIARAAGNDTFFVADFIGGDISVLERQSDNTLVKAHTIPMDRGVDNLSIDADGVLWAAGIPFPLTMVAHIADPSRPAPMSAHAITQNTGPSGDKFRVEQVFEDDGTIATGTTSVTHDSQRRLLFLHGLGAPHLTVCKL
ncbi:hypothetical protein C8R43DRAFT_580192 [Mycena crocata]|nr:hypothetical protein C8R43DRAFT_580192 [Mycena crocata]